MLATLFWRAKISGEFGRIDFRIPDLVPRQKGTWHQVSWEGKEATQKRSFLDIVWDKSGSIRFKKPGKGTVRAYFQLSKEEIDSIRSKAGADPKVEPQFTVNVLDETGSVVAEVQKVLHVRRKDRSKENSVT